MYTFTTLFNIFLDRILTDAVEDHEGTVSIGGRTITNLRYADNIDGSAGEEKELANFVERLDRASTAYGMEISVEETKLMTNNTTGIKTEIKVNRQKLETVTSFKYLGSVISGEGSRPQIILSSCGLPDCTSPCALWSSPISSDSVRCSWVFHTFSSVCASASSLAVIGSPPLLTTYSVLGPSSSFSDYALILWL